MPDDWLTFTLGTNFSQLVDAGSPGLKECTHDLVEQPLPRCPKFHAKHMFVCEEPTLYRVVDGCVIWAKISGWTWWPAYVIRSEVLDTGVRYLASFWWQGGTWVAWVTTGEMLPFGHHPTGLDSIKSGGTRARDGKELQAAVLQAEAMLNSQRQPPRPPHVREKARVKVRANVRSSSKSCRSVTSKPTLIHTTPSQNSKPSVPIAWTMEEAKALCDLVRSDGVGDWESKASRLSTGRSGGACKMYYIRVLRAKMLLDEKQPVVAESSARPDVSSDEVSAGGKLASNEELDIS